MTSCAWCNGKNLVSPGHIPMVGAWKTCPDCGGKNLFTANRDEPDGLVTQMIPEGSREIYNVGIPPEKKPTAYKSPEKGQRELNNLLHRKQRPSGE